MHTLPIGPGLSRQPTPGRGRLRHIPELDGVRGLAALVVVVYHLTVSLFHPVSLAAWGPAVRTMHQVCNWGYAGVDLFFVLSGFLITSILLEERDKPGYYKNFYWKRVLRILPLYLLCLAGAALFKQQHAYALLSVVFLANFASVLHIPGDGPYWSLAIEEQFYLLWPTLVRKVQLKGLMRWSVALGLACVALRLVFASAGHFNHYLTFLRCDGLAFGAGIACFYRKAAQSPAKQPATAVFSGLLLLGFLLTNGANFLHNIAFFAAVSKTGVTLICGAGTGLIVLYSGARVFAPLRSRLLVFFGLISYAIYMFHTYVVELWDHFVGPLQDGDEQSYWLRIVACLALTTGLAIVSRYAIELPAMRLRRYVLSHPLGHLAERGAAQLPLARMD